MSGTEKYRTLVTEALKPILSESQLTHALDAWASAFAGKTALIPSMVAAHVAKELGASELEENIRTRLTQGLLAEHGLNQTKSPSATPSVQGSRNPVGGNAGDGSVVFRAILAGLANRLRALLGSNADQIELEWCEAFGSAKLQTGTREAIERWCRTATTGNDMPIGGNIPVEDMRTVVHSIYVWCCEALGPVETDRVFAETVEETSALPVARHFAPSTLL